MALAAPASSRLPSPSDVAAVAAGGAAGGTLRYAFILAFPTDPGTFPRVILAENLIGAFLLGLVLTGVLERWRLPRRARPFLTAGLLGSFTTFSNLSVDLVQLASMDRAWVALAYGAASTCLGVAAALLGLRLGRQAAGAR
jgi:fluoride exporter